MRTLWIQLILIIGTLLIAVRLMAGTGQRTLAIRRLGLIAFAGLAILSILFPSLWTRLAQLVGIGRGTDLILYALVVAFFGFVATTFRRQREADQRYTRLARRLALDEAPPPSSATAQPPQSAPASPTPDPDPDPGDSAPEDPVS